MRFVMVNEELLKNIEEKLRISGEQELAIKIEEVLKEAKTDNISGAEL